jgi:hypothetical protein
MSICIIDPASHMPGLKYLFPEAEYFAHEPDAFFTYVSTHHYTKQQNLQEYGFEYRTDWNAITDKQFSVVFIVLPLMDYFNVVTTILTPHINRMLGLFHTIFSNNRFQKVVMFDMYDYDYDPNDVNTDIPVDFYFKRFYNKNKQYKPNVFPFPCSMFVKPCVISTMLAKNLGNSVNRINSPMWAGAIYNHVDGHFHPPIVRNRKDMFERIKHKLTVYNGLPIEEYIAAIRKHTIVVDLIGVGEPNKRTFEGFANGTLVMTMVKDLHWGFEEGDAFHPDTLFSSGEEFEQKIDRLLHDKLHYNICLTVQNYLVDKYFNKDWMRTYILRKLSM